MADEAAPRERASGKVVVIVLAAIIFTTIGATYFLFFVINPSATLVVDLVADCEGNTTDCDALAYTELDPGSITNLTLLDRVLQAYDDPDSFDRAERVNDTLIYESTREPVRQLVQFLEDRLALQHPELVVDGRYTGAILFRHENRVFDLRVG